MFSCCCPSFFFRGLGLLGGPPPLACTRLSVCEAGGVVLITGSSPKLSLYAMLMGPGALGTTSIRLGSCLSAASLFIREMPSTMLIKLGCPFVPLPVAAAVEVEVEVDAVRL